MLPQSRPFEKQPKNKFQDPATAKKEQKEDDIMQERKPRNKLNPVHISREPGSLHTSTSFGRFHYCSTSIFSRAPGSISSMDAEACSSASL